MTLVACDKSLICGCKKKKTETNKKANLAFIQQIVREAYYFMLL